MPKTIYFDENVCVGCHACSTACKIWRQRPLGIEVRRIEKRWKGAELSVRPVYISLACQHCVDPACVTNCPEKALQKQGNIVVLEEKLCVSCQACLAVCPYEVPAFVDDKSPMIKCDQCSGLFDEATEMPPCVTTCPTKALTFQEYSPAKQEEKEKAMTKALETKN